MITAKCNLRSNLLRANELKFYPLTQVQINPTRKMAGTKSWSQAFIVAIAPSILARYQVGPSVVFYDSPLLWPFWAVFFFFFLPSEPVPKSSEIRTVLSLGSHPCLPIYTPRWREPPLWGSRVSGPRTGQGSDIGPLDPETCTPTTSSITWSIIDPAKYNHWNVMEAATGHLKTKYVIRAIF